jgi:hypothetical protein
VSEACEDQTIKVVQTAFKVMAGGCESLNDLIGRAKTGDALAISDLAQKIVS